MATTLSYHNSIEAGSTGPSTSEYGNRYISSRRSSSSSSGSQTRPIVARPYSHLPTAMSRTQSSYFAHERPQDVEEVLSTNDYARADVGAGSTFIANRPPVSYARKGKERATTYSERPSTMYPMGEDRPKEYRSSWRINQEVARIGADSWVERDPVILILGRPTPDSLSPLLYHPQYAQTLIIIALSTPCPAFTQFASQTPSERTTYPIIQLIDMSTSPKVSATQQITAMLEQASKMSFQWRASLRNPPPSRMSWIGAGSRRSSSDSMGSSISPLTPPMSQRNSMQGPQLHSRRSSETSSSSHLDATNKRLSSTPSSYRDSSRPTPSNRKSSFFGMGKTGSESQASRPASPFDAVIHILPPASEYPANRALQEMLQSTVLLTSAVVPILAKRNLSTNSSKTAVVDVTPVTLIHVIQPNSPAALPPVVENFVLSLLPRFQNMCERRLSTYVVSQEAWTLPAEREIMSGGDLLLFGGAEVRPSQMPDGSVRTKKRAHIPYWPHQGPPMKVAPNPDFTRPDYSTLVPLAPPASEKSVPPAQQRRKSNTNRSPPSSRPGTRHHRSGLSQSITPSDLEDISSLHIPDLDHAPSSASSQSHGAATPRASTQGSELGSPTPTFEEGIMQPQTSVSVLVKEKKQGGFGSFVKRFGKKH